VKKLLVATSKYGDEILANTISSELLLVQATLTLGVEPQ
jgi:hypothetical protein